jgi:hypothetical protein
MFPVGIPRGWVRLNRLPALSPGKIAAPTSDAQMESINPKVATDLSLSLSYHSEKTGRKQHA